MIKFSLNGGSILCFGITEDNMLRMADGDPIYVLKDDLRMPQDFQMTISKQRAIQPGRDCFILDLTDISQKRLRSGAALNIGSNQHWPVEATIVYYGKNDEELKLQTEKLTMELTGKTFKELAGKDLEDLFPVPKGTTIVLERES